MIFRLAHNMAIIARIGPKTGRGKKRDMMTQCKGNGIFSLIKIEEMFPKKENNKKKKDNN